MKLNDIIEANRKLDELDLKLFPDWAVYLMSKGIMVSPEILKPPSRSVRHGRT